MTAAGPWWEGGPGVLPPDPELEPLHERDYVVRAWRQSDTSMLIRGAVMDLKPGRPFAERIRAAGGTDDERPLPIHHMVVDLTVSYPDLTITGAEIVYESFPQPGCPAIIDRYRELVGISIARGFTHEVRQRFGGPRGCTHVTALLQAMAPVAVQCMFSMHRLGPGSDGPAGDGEGGGRRTGGRQMAFMRDTCHVWASEGELWQGVTVGQAPPMALPMRQRARDGGLDPDRVDL